MTRNVRAAAALIGALLVGVLLATPASAATARDTTGDGGAVDRPVVLVGVPGLTWSDAQDMGALLDPLIAADELAAGSLVVRSTSAVACPADGWLAISAGNRASADRADGGCLPVAPDSPDWDDRWQGYLDRAAAASFTAEPGLLGDLLADAGVTTSAIGAGAAVALATSDGGVADADPYLVGSAEGQVREALEDSDLVVVDLGGTRLGSLSSTTRPEAVAAIAEELGVVLDGAQDSGRDPVILISGISDAAGDEAAELRFFAATGLGGGEISSPSTRQPGYLLGTDQHATLLDLLGLDDDGTSSIGAPIAVGPAASDGLLDAALDRERHADAQRPLIPGFFLSLVLINLSLFAVVALGLRRARFARTVATRREPVLRALRVVALGVAAIPIASFLTNLLPWWRAEPPLLALLGGILVVDAAIVALALLGPWRRALLGPAAVVAAVTAVVLGIDVVTGATLQVSAIMGIPTLVAGRFYGMNNTSFALFASSSLVLTTAIANDLVQRGRRPLAAAVTAAIGIVVIVANGAPMWGADFGGPPALLVAFSLLVLMAAGIRLSIRRVALLVVGAGLITLGIAFLDWLRPPGSRTHLGRFFADLLDGDVWTVIGRKLDQNLTILLGNRPLTILAICGVLLVVLILIRPVRRTITSPDGGEYAWLSGGAPISAMAQQAPMLAPGLIALATAMGIGFAVNDSGIAIPAIGVAVTVPLLLASCATWMLDLSGDRPPVEATGQAPR